eukprot:16447496-Heterocapsa_arctica.AAC.1
MTGAKKNDMSKAEEIDCRRWMDENPNFKTEAMNNVDKKLLDGIEGTGRVISPMQETLSGQILDNLIGGHIADLRGSAKIDMDTHSCH